MIDYQLIIICTLTAGINLIGTLAYAARIAGVRTRRIALSFALFNILVLVSRTSNGFLGPFLAKRVEMRLIDHAEQNLVWDFQLIMASASIAVAFGILLVPTGQRIFTKAISQFQIHKSIIKLLAAGLRPKGVNEIRRSLSVPRFNILLEITKPSGVSIGIILSNTIAQALLTVGVISSIYAGYLNMEFRVTASQLSSVINGVATILLFTCIDPQLSQLTDDVVQGQTGEELYRRTIVWISMSRLLGTIISQVLFLPAAHLIVAISSFI